MKHQETDQQFASNTGSIAHNIEQIKDLAASMFSDGQVLADYFGIHPNTEEVEYQLAKTKYDHNQYKDALQIFKKLCFNNHLNNKYNFGLASCAMMLGHHEQAAKAFAYCHLLESTDPAPTYYAMICSIKMEKWQEANECAMLTEQLAKNNLKKYEDFISKTRVAKKIIAKNLKNNSKQTP